MFLPSHEKVTMNVSFLTSCYQSSKPICHSLPPILSSILIMEKSGIVHSTKSALTEETKSKSQKNLTIWSHEASIDITFDKSIYTSPDIVNATITITDQKLIKLDSLVVEIQGYEEISFLDLRNDTVIETRIISRKHSL